MTSTLVQGAAGIFTGLPGEAMRATGAIRIVDGRIAAVGSLEREPGEQVIDASGCVIYPGLVSTHHHLFQCVLKGVRAAIDSPLLVWLRAVPYAYWHKIDEEALRTAARIGLVELLLSGTTTAADHHYLFAESYRFDPADVIFEVAEQLGIRLVFCRGGATKARGFDTPDIIPTPVEPIETMIKSVEACAQRHHDPSPDSMRRVAFAPTTPPWSLAPDQPRVIAAAARHMGLRIHGHLSETMADVEFCLAAYGKRPVAWMADNDYLGRDVWLAHLVHVDDDEIRLLAETGTGMAHCPQSNCRLGSGIAPAERLAALGRAGPRGGGGARRRRVAGGRRRRVKRVRRHDQRDEQRLAHPSRRQRGGRREHRGRGEVGQCQRRARSGLRGGRRHRSRHARGSRRVRVVASALFRLA